MQPNFLETFQIEAEELLDEVERCGLQLEADASNADVNDLINRIFRSFHNIKSSCGMFGLKSAMNFAHKVETLLDLVREGEVPVTPQLGGILVAASDRVRALLEGQPANERALQLEKTIEELAKAQRPA